MPISQELESQHQDLLGRIEESGRVDSAETIKIVKQAMISIRGETNQEIKERKIQEYESLRKKVLKEYLGIQEVGLRERSDFQIERNKDAKITALTQPTAKTQEEKKSTFELNPEEEKDFKKKQMAFFVEQLSIKDDKLIKPVPKKNGGKVEKAFEKFIEGFGSKRDIVTYLKEKDPNTRTSLLKQEVLDTPEKIINVLKNLAEGNNDTLKGYFQNLSLEKQRNPELIVNMLLSFSNEVQKNQNGRISKFIQNFFGGIEGIKGKDEIITPIIERLEKERNNHSYNIGAIAGEILGISDDSKLAKKLTLIIKDNKESLWVFLTNMPIDLLDSIRDDSSFLKQAGISQELLHGVPGKDGERKGGVYEVRGEIYKTFQGILKSWLESKVDRGKVEIAGYKIGKNENGGDIEWDKQEQIDFINSQIITQGGLKAHRQSFEVLVKKDPIFIERVELLKSDKSIMSYLIDNKREVMPYILTKISPELLNDHEIIDKIIRNHDDKAYVDLIFSRVSDKNSREYLQRKMESLGINYNRDVFRDIGFSKESINKEIVEQKISSQIPQEGQIKELSTDKGIISNRNENGTYNVTIQGQSILGLTTEEYEGLENEKVKENLLHFYTVLKDCGLEQIWGQRESIFKAITNQKGIAFNTKDGDYLGKNEVKIFLQSIIKSIAPQFKDQGELTKALNTENEQEIISFITNYNGENNLAGPAKDKLGRTKITELFFDTYFPQNSDRKFQQASFENSL